MGTSYKEYSPHQIYLLPQNPAEWLPEDHFQALEQSNVKALVSIGREGKTTKAIANDKKLTKRMLAKLQTTQGKKLYKRRKGIVEPVFSWIKQALGFRKFSVRGFTKVSGEWYVVCCAINLKRLSSMIQWVKP